MPTATARRKSKFGTASPGYKNAQLRECRKVARERGGKFLSKEYTNAKDGLEWQCANGHIWKASWDSVSRGVWCRMCAAVVRASAWKRPFSELLRLAKTHGGMCLSSDSEYKDQYSKIQWECAKGHRFRMMTSVVVRGGWCTRCHRLALSDDWLSIRMKRLAKIASKKGGRIVEIDSANRLRCLFECKKGHRWWASSKHVIYSRSWCAHCAGSAKFTMADVKKIAKRYKGRFLGKSYINSRVKMSWECEHGHTFMKAVEVVNQGIWCAECSMLKRLLECTKRLAQKLAGRCVSEFYEGPQFANRVAIFECHRKHQWKMSHSDLKNGHWCPVCAANAVLNL